MNLVIQWGHKKHDEFTCSHKELSFRSNNPIHSQLPLVMITTLLVNIKDGSVESGWVNFNSDSIFRFFKKIRRKQGVEL